MVVVHRRAIEQTTTLRKSMSTSEHSRIKGLATNRAEQKVQSTKAPASSYQPGDYGIDYLELGFSIREPGDLKSTRYVTWKPRGYDTPDGPVITSGWLEIVYRGHTIRLNAYRSKSFGWRCFLHFNPSRIVDPVGMRLCRPRDLHDVISEVMGVVSQYVRPTGPSDYFRVHRVDVARNFRGITSPIDYLTGLHGVYRPHAQSTSLISDRSGRLGTLRSGSQSGGWVQLYDKHLQSPHLAQEGTMRAEVQARESWCQRYGGIYTVSDLTIPNLSRLMRNRIRWFGLEREVVTFETACEKILRNRQLDRRVQDNLVRYILERQMGLDLTATPKSIAKYRSILGDMNISVQLERDLAGSVGHLDLRSGTEVRAA